MRPALAPAVSCTGSIAVIPLPQLRGIADGWLAVLLLLLHAALFTDYGIGVQEDFDIGVGEYLRSNVAAFHDHSAVLAKLALACDHPFANLRMHGHARGTCGDIGFPHALGHITPVEEDTIASQARLKLNA